MVLKDEILFDKGDPCSRMLFLHEGSMVYGDPQHDVTHGNEDLVRNVIK